MAALYPVHPLPPRVLERSDVRDALVRHEFGEVFRLAKKWGGVSWNRIGEACGIKPERVSKMAQGASIKITSFDKIAEISDGLRIPGHMLGLAPRPWEEETRSGQPTAWSTASFPAVVQPGTPVTHDMNVGPWEVAELASRTNATDVRTSDLEITTLAVERLCCAYPYMPAKDLHRQTRLGIKHVTDLLDRRTTLKQHRELLVHAGWLFLLGGCLEYDLGERAAAEISRTTARRIGQETGHGEIVAWSFELDAWFALTQGRYRDVLDVVEAGHRADSTHSVGVQLYAHAGKAYARIGNSREVSETLDAGRARLDRLPRPEHRDHHFVIDPNKWDFYAMDAYRMLGDDDRATRHANEVIRLGTAPDGTETFPMRVAEARLTLGMGAARSGELERAVTMAERALETPRKSLPSLLLVAGELIDELTERYPNESLTKDFQGRVRNVASAARASLEPSDSAHDPEGTGPF